MEDILSLQKLLEPHKKDINSMSIDDAMLKRYLIASHTIQEAYERILATDKWRKEFPVASVNINSKGIQKIIDMKVVLLCDEKDADGRPIVYVAVKNHFMKNRCLEEWTNFIIYVFEQSLSKCSKGMENVCVLFDMKGFSLSVMDYEVLKILYDIFLAHYPERLGRALVRNSPFIFKACWAIIRPWIDENTASKVKFVTDADLGSYVDPKILPDI
ncbi:unnamed protein product [Meganyctiphanes norvegica]|uniref:CRAL-TRIO domain-containing protein n=1 Tax=Meganyctiphanes norvegica TaxID=48144 RepID=A0AAV2QB92_MEGNR